MTHNKKQRYFLVMRNKQERKTENKSLFRDGIDGENDVEYFIDIAAAHNTANRSNVLTSIKRNLPFLFIRKIVVSFQLSCYLVMILLFFQ